MARTNQVKDLLDIPLELNQPFNSSCLLLNSSLKYFITWMKVVTGMRLDYPATNNCGRIERWNIFGACFIFLLNCAVNVTMVSYSFGFIFSSDENDSNITLEMEKLSNVKLFTLIIDIINVTLYLFAVHLTFLVVFFIRWKNLYNILVKIESQMSLTDLFFYQKIRRIVFIGFLLIAIVFQHLKNSCLNRIEYRINIYAFINRTSPRKQCRFVFISRIQKVSISA